jgi:plasmid stabilization system protein ParE
VKQLRPGNGALKRDVSGIFDWIIPSRASLISHRETMERTMPQGDKSAYTDKQKRKAAHIEEGYEDRGTPKQEAERRAWATVNKESGGGKKSGSGRGAEKRSAAAKKGWETRRRRGAA